VDRLYVWGRLAWGWSGKVGVDCSRLSDVPSFVLGEKPSAVRLVRVVSTFART
jgi:hypothetical protein